MTPEKTSILVDMGRRHDNEKTIDPGRTASGNRS